MRLEKGEASAELCDFGFKDSVPLPERSELCVDGDRADLGLDKDHGVSRSRLGLIKLHKSLQTKRNRKKGNNKNEGKGKERRTRNKPEVNPSTTPDRSKKLRNSSFSWACIALSSCLRTTLPTLFQKRRCSKFTECRKMKLGKPSKPSRFSPMGKCKERRAERAANGRGGVAA